MLEQTPSLRSRLRSWFRAQSLSFRAKISIFLTLYIVAMLFVLFGIIRQLERRSELNQSRVEARNVLNNFARVIYSHYSPVISRQQFSKSMQDAGVPKLFSRRPDIVYAAFQDAQGHLQYVPRREPAFDWVIARTQLDRATEKLLSVTGFSSRLFAARVGESVRELLVEVRGADNRPIGVARLGLREQIPRSFWGPFTKEALWRVFLVNIITALIGLPLILFVASRFEAPIIDLHKRARHLLGTKPELKMKGDVVAHLSKEFSGIEALIGRLRRHRAELVGTLSHEFRSPMQAIQGYVDFLRQGGAGPMTSELEKYLTIIGDNAARFETFIDNVLDLVRSEGGRLPIKVIPVDVKTVVTEAVQLFHPKAGESKIHLSGEIPPQTGPALGDASRISQVLVNLIANALKFTPAGGVIRAGVKNLGDVVGFFVADNGPGIPQELHRQVFEEFYQVPDREPLRGSRGLGLGLTLSKQLVEAQNGKIWIEPTNGGGTTVWFSLPLAKEMHIEAAQYSSR